MDDASNLLFQDCVVVDLGGYLRVQGRKSQYVFVFDADRGSRTKVPAHLDRI